MADLPSVASRIQIEETEFRAPVSESSVQKVGSSINYILDHFMVDTGTITVFAGLEASVPGGKIVCDGRAVSRTTYANLFAVISTLYGIGDGSSTFNVPDMRGIFPRMVDTTTAGSAGRDPDESIRTPTGTGTAAEPGSYQSDEFESHAHLAVGGGLTSGGNHFNLAEPNTNITQFTNAAGGSTETRPKNLYFLFLIQT